MSRDNSTYKETYNRGLDYIRELGRAASLPSETELATNWGSSRTTVRSVLAEFREADIVEWNGRRKTVLRTPKRNDYYPSDETTSAGERVETKFMAFILGGDIKPGAILRESELVREFEVSTSVVREFLIRFSRFGLIEKEPNRHWVMRGFTRKFAIELFDVREMFEHRALQMFLRQKLGDEVEAKLDRLEADHRQIIGNIDENYLDFPRLDERFHRLFVDNLDNRFVGDFFELVSVIFHYHYRWKKQDEKERNLAAAHQHLAVIHAIKEGDLERVQTEFDIHLQDARNTLLNSVVWDDDS